MNRLKVKGWGKIHSADNSQKTAGVAIFILDKVDFYSKNITTDKERHFLMMNESIHQQYITILNVYVPKNKTSKYKK